MKENLIPKRRFREFENTDAWEQRKLGDIAYFNPKSILPNEFEYVDLESVLGTKLISHRAETRKAAPSRAKRLALRGDVFYQTVRPYQKNNYLYDLPDENYVFSTGYAQLRPLGDSYFLLSRLQEEKFVLKVLENSTGTSYPAINSNDLAQIEIRVPERMKEEKKIGCFFKKIDQLIALHQRKLEKVKALKSAYLSEMFPVEGENEPKRRFSGFTNAWEQRKLSQLLDIRSGRDYKHLSMGDIPVYGTGGYMLSVNEALSYREDAIGIGRKGTIDRPFLLLAPFWTVDTLFYAVPREKNNLYFIYCIFQRINWKRRDESTGVPSLSKTAINSIPALIPEKQEQDKIAEYFSNLDNLIALHQRKLEKLKNIKTAFLNEMFV